MNSKTDFLILVAKERGLYTKDGVVFSKKGKPRKTSLVEGYPSFSIKFPKSRKSLMIKCHRLAAYEKYGASLFGDGIVVRHGSLGPLNFSHDNLLIGTQSDNSLDRNPETRRTHSVRAASFLRKFTDTVVLEIKNDRKSGLKYKEIMKKYGISSKGTLYYILNSVYLTIKE